MCPLKRSCGTVTTLALVWLHPDTVFQRQLVRAFTSTNLTLIWLNLIPVRPLDGAEAWRLLALVWRDRAEIRKARETATKAAQERRAILQRQADAADKKADELDADATRAIDEALLRHTKVKPGQR